MTVHVKTGAMPGPFSVTGVAATAAGARLPLRGGAATALRTVRVDDDLDRAHYKKKLHPPSPVQPPLMSPSFVWSDDERSQDGSSIGGGTTDGSTLGSRGSPHRRRRTRASRGRSAHSASPPGRRDTSPDPSTSGADAWFLHAAQTGSLHENFTLNAGGRASVHATARRGSKSETHADTRRTKPPAALRGKLYAAARAAEAAAAIGNRAKVHWRRRGSLGSAASASPAARSRHSTGPRASTSSPASHPSHRDSPAHTPSSIDIPVGRLGATLSQASAPASALPNHDSAASDDSANEARRDMEHGQSAVKLTSYGSSLASHASYASGMGRQRLATVQSGDGDGEAAASPSVAATASTDDRDTLAELPSRDASHLRQRPSARPGTQAAGAVSSAGDTSGNSGGPGEHAIFSPPASTDADTPSALVSCWGLCAHVDNVALAMRRRATKYVNSFTNGDADGFDHSQAVHRLAFRETFILRVRRVIQAVNHRLQPILLASGLALALSVLMTLLSSARAFISTDADVAGPSPALRLAYQAPSAALFVILAAAVARVHASVVRLAHLVGTTSVFDGAWDEASTSSPSSGNAGGTEDGTSVVSRVRDVENAASQSQMSGDGGAATAAAAAAALAAGAGAAAAASQARNGLRSQMSLQSVVSTSLAVQYGSENDLVEQSERRIFDDAQWTPWRVALNIEVSDADTVISAALPSSGISVVGEHVVTWDVLMQLASIIGSMVLLWLKTSETSL